MTCTKQKAGTCPLIWDLIDAELKHQTKYQIAIAEEHCDVELFPPPGDYNII